jgi:hypothetical protein
VIDEINTGGRSETHLPARGQRTKLADGLRLDCEVVTTRSEDAQDLLPTRIDPCRCSSVVIDEVDPAFRCKPLFPSCWKRSSARARRCTCCAGCVCGGGCGGGLILRGGPLTSRAEEVIGSDTCIVSSPLADLGIGLSSSIDRGITGWSRPSGGSRVVVNIIRSAQVINPAFPTLGERAVLVLSRVEGASGIVSAGRARRGRV